MKNLKRFRRQKKILLLLFTTICFITTVFYMFIQPIGKEKSIMKLETNIAQVVIICATNEVQLKTKNMTDTLQIDKLERLLSSIVRKSPSEQIHLNIITYDKEVPAVKEAVKTSLNACKSISCSFVSLELIQENFGNQIELSQKYMSHNKNRYHDVAAHIRPFYPQVFSYKKIISLDLDLEFRSSFTRLYKQFKNMQSHQIIGMSYEQAPYYRYVFKDYRTKMRYKTSVGSPYPGYQGYNTGVILFDLEKARQSKEYNSHLSEKGYNYLLDKYKMKASLGDQDFFTVLGAEYPHLFYILECSFNRQMSPNYFFSYWFDKYHKCENEVQIYHGNGDSLIPDKDSEEA